MKTVLVFKTSVVTEQQAGRLKPVLDKLMHAREKWNFDLEDCDRILRVEAFTLRASVVIAELNRAGFFCAELED
ncbi:hypothetical protein [Adhaeribacter soli]|uniref:Uncharacterized protein n=1 Tax=Adhaeribacter soli TaxID=2607655 RepID=A0A5N1J6Q5_9BACT|nr:hypothetical protein [Adhaeribacter soli]KAA9340877.1 hypothetical protein F0P94_05455 [Adhaeribacter soli]